MKMEHYNFQGALEENETLEECLLRELQEETGIKLKDIKLKSFMKITYYNKNYHNRK
jgi:8-oxo-dGTP pyrophosphatase MutT (NUDIX family)